MIVPFRKAESTCSVLPAPSGEPAAAVYNRTARFFRGVAAELEWEELYFSQTDDGEQIDCAYKKRLRRRRHPPGHSRLE